MSKNEFNCYNQVILPIYELDDSGHIKPNTMFHRPWDKLHSRCIEYPFAASRLGKARIILDVGTIKADSIWINWLENLPMQVHATDYDKPITPFKNITFHQADLRRLPLPDNFFDKIMAVSVIEHIGLESPQVLAKSIPKVSNDGDLEAFRELARVLKPGGELIMTVPFGVIDGLILGNQARNYTVDTIKSFDRILTPRCIEYYEYQSKNYPDFSRHDLLRRSWSNRIFRKMIASLKAVVTALNGKKCIEHDQPGEVTWKNLLTSQSKAIQKSHVEGVVCGVWNKI